MKNKLTFKTPEKRIVLINKIIIERLQRNLAMTELVMCMFQLLGVRYPKDMIVEVLDEESSIPNFRKFVVKDDNGFYVELQYHDLNPSIENFLLELANLRHNKNCKIDSDRKLMIVPIRSADNPSASVVEVYFE